MQGVQTETVADDTRTGQEKGGLAQQRHRPVLVVVRVGDVLPEPGKPVEKMVAIIWKIVFSFFT
jgi:hypothetical protein